MQRYLPQAVIFLTGFITMAFEVVGSRALGPFFGTSIFVWTSLIGIVMGSLSIGYWLGGLLSVRKTSFQWMGFMLLVAGIFVAITAIGDTYILPRIEKYIPGFRLKNIVAVIVLFAPASILFGMVLPYGIRLSMGKVTSSGKTVGVLYALSSLGSILGSFAAGFILVPAFGYSNIMYSLAFGLILLSLILFLSEKRYLHLSIPSVAILILFFIWNYKSKQIHDYIDLDTQYNRVLIFNSTDAKSGRMVKTLRINDENSSAMFLDGDKDELVFEVLKYYHLVDHFVPGFQHALMVGGSGYAFPKAYLKSYPSATLDVVEIDPGLTAVARKYFELEENHRLNIFHEDGRIFLNNYIGKKYDAVFMDAYKSMLTIPYQLTTLEAIQKISDVLKDDGAVFANVISSLDKNKSEFLRAEVATYQKVFPQVYLFAVQYPNPTEEQKKHFQNIMLVGLKSTEKPNFISEDLRLNKILSHLTHLELENDPLIITDEFAPVEYFASKVLK